jgi:hypothetical protein
MQVALQPESELVQLDLQECVNQGHLGALKQLRMMEDPAHAGLPTVLHVDADVGKHTELAIAVGLLMFKEEGDADVLPPPDLSVSCSSTDLLPQLPTPGHPLASHCYVWERIHGRTHLLRKEVLNLRKMDFFDWGVMVSRKCTRNLTDLFNTWKHSIKQLPEEIAVDLTLSDMDDFD